MTVIKVKAIEVEVHLVGCVGQAAQVPCTA
ncbi:hypothetical protein RO3G_15139 [Rhizopus delemar RA 99-880]|uniref:Uncharacterized protein n=1 Tax=Rhizopus delemar (strain RA 99-880 / ATCC MYA-4621 / FGSC 9543 / NRRL 43880) TaxID=246409 RepID=I1CPP8_RHIO9|nr:hypothetical protein RO3G_15139 [Rhizopus delemar RA 99-880]|eukprot:EIE90428.1 hypothetical protein RO3G_15139 [Rhizopus delemar RA 99-880]